jgi:hypothetical protein
LIAPGQHRARRTVDVSARVCDSARVVAVAWVAVVLVAGCGSIDGGSGTAGIPRALVLQARPIGQGARFHPPATGPVIGGCRRQLGPRTGVHVEIFAANRVVLLAAGIGARPPWRFSAGRISGARCYGELVTLEPTGVVLLRPGLRLSLADLFRGWGEPLSQRRVAAFLAPAGTRVAVFVDGRRWHGSPAGVPLAAHSEIVVEVGPYVPPHPSYTFPPGT